MMKDFIEKMYNNTINIVLRDFDDNEKQEISQNYYNYLNNIYTELLKDNDYDINELYEMMLNLEKEKWSELQKQEKQVILIEDKNYKEILQISEISKNLVMDRLNYAKIINEDEANKYINAMNELLKDVKLFNLENASILVNDAIIDFMFAANLSDAS